MACVAVVTIPQGTYSKPFRASEINVNAVKEIRGNVKINFPLQVGLAPSGEMQPVTALLNDGIFWPKLIDIASDCHDQNIKLSRWHSKDTLVLQATRDILVGQPLQLWFSEDLMITELGIPPYLSPFNIKGGNSYVCHECNEKFERPNFLKLHLALHCDRLSTDTIWNRLKTTASPLLLNHPYLMTISPTPSSSGSPCPLFAISPTVTSSSSSLKLNSPSPPLLHHHHPHHHYHAQHQQLSRKHLQIPNLHLNMNKELLATRASTVSSSSASASSSTSSPIIGIEAPVEASRPADADEDVVPATPPAETNGRNSLVVQEQHHHHARLEAIVSNMGKAKNGHVCLYCGKLYSRKYGLKIHIRTHTGYKPLRCKICHRPFGDPSNLNKHVRLHSDGTTPYRCELCSKVLVRRRDLDRHMRARHHLNGSPTHGRSNGNGSLSLQGCSSSSRSTCSSTVTSSNMVTGSSL